MAAGVSPSRLSSEVVAPWLELGKLDLAIDGHAGTVIELKYPRDSRTGISPDTMTMGELVRDFLRVAVVSSAGRWVVQVLNVRLVRYLTDVGRRHPLEWSFDHQAQLSFNREALEGLPRTALTAIGEPSWVLPVTATCMANIAITPDLHLYSYRVEGPDRDAFTAPLVPRQVAPPKHDVPPPKSNVWSPPARPIRPGGASAEILAAIERIENRTGSSIFTANDVVSEMRRSGARFAEATVRTMVTSHMCADSQGPGIDSHADLERVGRGEYRRRHMP